MDDLKNIHELVYSITNNFFGVSFTRIDVECAFGRVYNTLCEKFVLHLALVAYLDIIRHLSAGVKCASQGSGQIFLIVLIADFISEFLSFNAATPLFCPYLSISEYLLSVFIAFTFVIFDGN